MEITEVRVKLMEDSDDRLQAFCSITFDDCFVVRDLKIIEGSNGPFVAMPSRKLTSHCHQCGSKNHLRCSYCNHCGSKQHEERPMRDHEGRAKLYADIAHPINSQCREMIQGRVIDEYRAERDRSQQPGYVSRYDDDYDFGEERAASTARKERRADKPAEQAVDQQPIEEPTEQPLAQEPVADEPVTDEVEVAEAQQEEREVPASRATHIEPGEQQPPPPHSLPSRQSQGRPRTRGRKSEDFGAGIFPD